MLKRIKFKNSTVLLIGIIFILTGVCIGFIDYYVERREKVFADMNLLLYETEEPSNIISEEEIEQKQEELNNSVSSEEVTTQEKPIETKYDYIGILEIPKINLKRGFLKIGSRYNNVNYNITVIKGSTFPDKENNNLILAAHSGSCSVCYFHNLFDLSKDDKAYIQYNNKRYSYKLVNTYEVEKDGTVPIYRDYSKNTLTLITCTKNSDTKQTVFIFELES